MMKTRWFALIGATLFASAMFAIPAHAVSLADLINTNGSIVVGPLTFDQFGGSALDWDVTGTVVGSEPGLLLTASGTLEQSDVGDPKPVDNLSYRVTSDAGILIHDLTHSIEVSVNGEPVPIVASLLALNNGDNSLVVNVGTSSQHLDLSSVGNEFFATTTLLTGGPPEIVGLSGSAFISQTYSLRPADGGPAVPEPTTLLLLGSGLAGLAAWRFRARA
ncbi:PEP-CTERM sorting domain-containing protein [Candidatus Nitrospira bockiana]